MSTMDDHVCINRMIYNSLLGTVDIISMMVKPLNVFQQPKTCALWTRPKRTISRVIWLYYTLLHWSNYRTASTTSESGRTIKEDERPYNSKHSPRILVTAVAALVETPTIIYHTVKKSIPLQYTNRFHRHRVHDHHDDHHLWGIWGLFGCSAWLLAHYRVDDMDVCSLCVVLSCGAQNFTFRAAAVIIVPATTWLRSSPWWLSCPPRLSLSNCAWPTARDKLRAMMYPNISIQNPK